MIDFALGIAVLCVLLAIPRLRGVAAAVLLVVVVVAGGLLWWSNQSSAPARRQDAAQDSRLGQADAADRSNALIEPADVDLRLVWLTALGQPLVETPQGTLNDIGVHAVVHNLSPVYTLTGMSMAIDLFDCPAAAPAPDDAGCDHIASAVSLLRAEVPPGQVRQMDGGILALSNLPPLRGHLEIRHKIQWTRGRDDRPPRGS
jgi:hypothetical protein